MLQKNVLITIILLLTIATITYGQSRQIKAGDEYYESGMYSKAREKYIKAYDKSKDKYQKAEIAYKIGMCSKQMHDAKNAEKWFRKSVRYHKNPLARLYLAEAQLQRGKIEEARTNYAEYKDLAPTDTKGEKGIMSCDSATKWIDNPTRYKIYKPRQFFSRQDDFAPSFCNDTTEIYFSSSRETSKGDKINYNTGQYFTDIFITKRDKKGKWSTAVPVKGAVNTEFDEGACFITDDGLTMYYTSCKTIKGQDLGCKIYVSRYHDGQWDSPEQLDLFNDSSITVGHPCLSPDGQTLYFSSNAKGGYGGDDIWMCKRAGNNGKWGQPVNLGATINTKGDEVFPFVTEDGTLYFSSDGHLTMGGLDILKAIPKENNSGWTIVNMKYPINSTADDFGIIWFNEKEGLLSSNREGSRGVDIYKFWIPPLKLYAKGNVRDENTGKFLYHAVIEVTGSDGSKKQTTTGDNGTFNIKLAEKTDYIFVATYPGYLKGVVKETTKGISKDKTLEFTIWLKPDSLVIEIPNIEYDFNSAELRPESYVALDELVELLKLNSNITIELMSHTDSRGSDKDNLELSERRAQSVVDYLVSKGISKDRLTPKGYGESKPYVVTKKVAEKYPFLKEGDVLTPEFIAKLKTEQQREIAHQLNRRTEFKVLRNDYDETGIPFGQ